MLDPVANTLDLRQPFDALRAKRVEEAIAATGVSIADVAYFDDMLHEDSTIRRKKHDFMISVMDAAVLLGVPAVCGFVGRDQSKSMDQNLIEFEQSFIPLLKAAKDRGLQYRVEQCPMPGWTPSDNFHNNLAYTPGTWIALHRICERNGVGDVFRIHYDPSHSILMGQDTRSMFQFLKDEGYGFLIAGMHVKGQVVDSRGVSAWGYGGQTIERGDWVDGQWSENPADLANSWKIQTVLCEHELPGTARHDPLAYLQNRSVDWLDHQLAARELLDFDPATTPLIVEHEYPLAACRTRICSSRSCRARSRSRVTSTRRLLRCTRFSTRCSPRRTSPSRVSAARPTGAEWPTCARTSVGTLDTKGVELRYLRDRVVAAGVEATLVDVSTSGDESHGDVTPTEVAEHHPAGAAAVFTGDRGSSVEAMSEALRRFVLTRSDLTGIVGAGGSGGTALVTPSMRALPVGVPKVMVSTVASGDVGMYVGPSDIAMMYSVTDVAGLNRISREVLGNAAHALAGMIGHRVTDTTDAANDRPLVGLTMFGVTTPLVTRLVECARSDGSSRSCSTPPAPAGSRWRSSSTRA